MTAKRIVYFSNVLVTPFDTRREQSVAAIGIVGSLSTIVSLLAFGVDEVRLAEQARATEGKRASWNCSTLTNPLAESI